MSKTPLSEQSSPRCPYLCPAFLLGRLFLYRQSHLGELCSDKGVLDIASSVSCPSRLGMWKTAMSWVCKLTGQVAHDQRSRGGVAEGPRQASRSRQCPRRLCPSRVRRSAYTPKTLLSSTYRGDSGRRTVMNKSGTAGSIWNPSYHERRRDEARGRRTGSLHCNAVPGDPLAQP
jgi:hypothetical protein